MLISMTGYGRAAVKDGYRTITVEMKSVNNRYFDVDFSMPKSFMYIEEQLKRNISNLIKRGKVTLNVFIEGEPITETRLDINWKLLDQVKLQMEKMQEKFHISNEICVTDVLQLPGVLTQTESRQDMGKFEPLIIQAENEALEQLINMRKAEGKTLSIDLRKRLNTISAIVEEIHQYVPQVLEQYQARLTKKIKDFLDGHFELDEERLMNEVAIYADKSDITEELLRLSSHIQQFLDIIEESEPKGRKLDFLVQEMNREINTIGSKSNDASISRHVVTVKSELEKIREQVQNIE